MSLQVLIRSVHFSVREMEQCQWIHFGGGFASIDSASLGSAHRPPSVMHVVCECCALPEVPGTSRTIFANNIVPRRERTWPSSFVGEGTVRPKRLHMGFVRTPRIESQAGDASIPWVYLQSEPMDYRSITHFSTGGSVLRFSKADRPPIRLRHRGISDCETVTHPRQALGLLRTLIFGAWFRRNPLPWIRYRSSLTSSPEDNLTFWAVNGLHLG